MKRNMMRILGFVLLGATGLLATSGRYNAHARSILHERLENAPREPGTNILRGAAPVTIDRGRRRVCLLLHGFMSSPADFGRLPEALDDAGWDVRAPLHPGHGRDPRKLRDIDSEDLISAAREELLALRKRYATVTLGGFSMGGSIAIILSGRHSPDATFLVNPFLGLRYRLKYILPLRWWYHLMGPLLDYGIRPETVPINRPEGRNQFVSYQVLPASIFGEVFNLADQAARTDLPGIPLLALISEDDQTAAPGKTKEYLRNAGSQTTEIKTYPRSNHILMLDYDREEAIEEAIRFLNNAVSRENKEP